MTEGAISGHFTREISGQRESNSYFDWHGCPSSVAAAVYRAGASCRIKSQDFVTPNDQFYVNRGLEELGKAHTTTQLKNNAIVGVWLTCLSLPLTPKKEFVFDYTV